MRPANTEGAKLGKEGKRGCGWNDPLPSLIHGGVP
jgi:hypothetical protein